MNKLIFFMLSIVIGSNLSWAGRKYQVNEENRKHFNGKSQVGEHGRLKEKYYREGGESVRQRGVDHVMYKAEQAAKKGDTAKLEKWRVRHQEGFTPHNEFGEDIDKQNARFAQEKAYLQKLSPAPASQ